MKHDGAVIKLFALATIALALGFGIYLSLLSSNQTSATVCTVLCGASTLAFFGTLKNGS